MAVAADPDGARAGRGDRHDRDPKTADGRQDAANFLGLSTVGEHDKHIVGREATQIAVSRFGRMQKMRSRAGGRQGRRDLPADQPCLAHSRNDDTAAALAQQVGRFAEFGVESGGHPRQRPRLVIDHRAGFTQQLELAIGDNRAFGDRAHSRHP